MQRVFIAIDISEEARAAAAQYEEALRREFAEVRVGWERPEKLHLTLKFLGKTDDDQLERVKRAVGSAAASGNVLTLELAGTGVFPSARSPRILWLGLRESGDALKVLANRMETECETIGFPKENRPFSPHLTIGRVREPHRSRELAEKHAASKFGPVAFVVNEVVVYKSELRPTGSIYSKLAAFPLMAV
jgi:RNA 2',3'-cyclic 3'-phosphodiesterase